MAWHWLSGRRAATAHDEGHLAAVPANDAVSWTSPVEAAARARLRGDRFFQIVVDDAALSAYAATTGGRRARRSSGATDLLGQIEELGWSLEHVTWWGGAEAPDPAAVRGVYLFRATRAEEVDGGTARQTPAPVTHLPTHRREVL
jgi:hypothetical protein